MAATHENMNISSHLKESIIMTENAYIEARKRVAVKITRGKFVAYILYKISSQEMVMQIFKFHNMRAEIYFVTDLAAERTRQ